MHERIGALVWRRSVEKDLRGMPRVALAGVVARIQSLVTDPRPHGSIKLQGGGDWYRIRHGDYRIVCEVRDREVVVTVVKVGHRREIYR